MARRRTTHVDTGPSHDEIVGWYREQLARPAVVPWNSLAPVRLGPTWQIDTTGHWVLPEHTIGWDVLGWCGTWLQLKAGVPWRFTLEQARFLLWWYSIDETGAFLHADGVLQRLKGWGKDPLGACLCAVEALGPCRFAEWENDQPVPIDVDAAWVQTAAVSLEQTKNTMRLFPSLFTAEAKKRFKIQIGKELIHALGDTRLIQAVTSSPTTLEGNRGTFILANETHHWGASNSGHDMADVIERNTVKAPDGGARRLAITNAFEPSGDSTAQRDREAWELAAGGAYYGGTNILYDSLEAPPDAPLALPMLDNETDAQHERRVRSTITEVVVAIRGDSTWLQPSRIVKSILDPRNPPSRSRRFWFNQIWAAEDAWAIPQDFALLERRDRIVTAGEEIVMFFDGSKSDDATGLVGCCMSDGHVFTLGLWQRPPGERGKEWTAPRDKVDDAVIDAFDRYTIVAFFGDPSHTRDDETQERYWDALFDEWHRRYRDVLTVWATKANAKDPGHSVMWDMTSPARSEQFTAAAERTQEDIVRGAQLVRDAQDSGRVEQLPLTWDGDNRLAVHVRNARRYPNRYGVSLWKGHRESSRKIDLAVCMVGARMVRRLVMNAPTKRKRTGKVW